MNKYKQSTKVLNRQKGCLGEDVACLFLERNGFKIRSRNYRRKWGEIDIVAQERGTISKTLHFFEVKSVANPFWDKRLGSHRPEENVHPLKASRISRMIITYMADLSNEAHFGPDAGQNPEFKFHILCVFMDMQSRRARVKWLKDIIL